MTQQTISQDKIVNLYEKFFTFQKSFLSDLKELVNDYDELQHNNKTYDNINNYSDKRTLEDIYDKLHEIENNDQMDMIRERMNKSRNQSYPINETSLENVLHNESNVKYIVKDDVKFNENNLAALEIDNLIIDNPDHEKIDEIIESKPVTDLNIKTTQFNETNEEVLENKKNGPPINPLYKISKQQRNNVIRDIFRQASENMRSCAEYDDFIKQNLEKEIQKESDRLLQVYIDSN